MDVTHESEKNDSINFEKSVHNDKHKEDSTVNRNTGNTIMTKKNCEKLEANKENKPSNESKITSKVLANHDSLSNLSPLDNSVIRTGAVNSKTEKNSLLKMVHDKKVEKNNLTTSASNFENDINKENCSANTIENVKDASNNVENMEVSASKDVSNSVVNTVDNLDVSSTDTVKVTVTNKAKESKSNAKPVKGNKSITKVGGEIRRNIVETLMDAISRTEKKIYNEKAINLLFIFGLIFIL